MNDKLNIGEVTVAEFNIIMKQLATGQLGECIDLFMKLRQIGQDFQNAQQMQMTPAAPPAEEQAE
jgi:hypothetical protein